MATEPELSVVATKEQGPLGNFETIVYPTIRSPKWYDKNGTKFFTNAADPFVCDEVDGVLSFFIRGIPIPQGRSWRGKNGNAYSKTRAAQQELASVIKNLMNFNLGSVPLFFLNRSSIHLKITCAFLPRSPRSHPGNYADVDNLAKFALNRLEEGWIFENDKNIQRLNISKSLDHRSERLPTFLLRETGGYFIEILLD